MAKPEDKPLSPTVNKILDEYHAVLYADQRIDNDAADRLVALFRKGKVPKFDDIDAALFQPPEEDKP